jgi:replicative DNA helicase
LKKLAKDLGIPIVALAQLSRKVEERQSQQIFLSDLKESGSIEEDSDVVIAINRRDMKDPYDHPGEAMLSVLKNRHGRTGESRLVFNKEACIFNEAPNV